MKYLEALEATVTRMQAKREIEECHGESWFDFLAEYGYSDDPETEYSGADVLAFLGY